MVNTEVDSDADAAVAQLAPFDDSFRCRVHVHRLPICDRVASLNAAIECAGGRYLAILDDDDLVFANWVECFYEADDTGALLRTRAVVQQVRRTRGAVSEVEAISGFELPFAAHFDLMQHLVDSQTPIHTVAFPMSVFHERALRFDPGLAVCEDLDVILQVAQECGVRDIEAITAVYRRWDDVEASAHSIPAEVWGAAIQRILDRLDSSPLRLPEGSASRLRRLLAELEMHRARGSELELLRASLIAERERRERAESRVAAFERSRFWRATAPLRAIVHRPAVRLLVRRGLRVFRFVRR